jgi:hypothetical protein
MSYIRDLEVRIGDVLENFIYDVIENRRPYRMDEFFAKAAEVIENTVKRKLGKDVRGVIRSFSISEAMSGQGYS